jgi:hypothetical protein
MPTAKVEAAKQTQGEGPVAHEDLDSDAWMDHYEDIFTCHLDGDWWVSSICPATYEGPGTGHKHEHSTKTGSASTERLRSSIVLPEAAGAAR